MTPTTVMAINAKKTRRGKRLGVGAGVLRMTGVAVSYLASIRQVGGDGLVDVGESPATRHGSVLPRATFGANLAVSPYGNSALCTEFRKNPSLMIAFGGRLGGCG